MATSHWLKESFMDVMDRERGPAATPEEYAQKRLEEASGSELARLVRELDSLLDGGVTIYPSSALGMRIRALAARLRR